MFGPNGVIEKTRNAELGARYSSILDKVSARAMKLEILFEQKKTGESADDFITRLQNEGLVHIGDNVGEDNYKNRTLKIGRIDGNIFKYSINIMDGTATGREI